MKLTVSKSDFTGLEPLVAGKYAATIEKVEFGKKAGADADDPGYYFVYFDVVDTPDGIPRSIREVFSNKPAAAFRWAALLKALGMAPEDDSALEFDPEELVGGQVIAAVTQREFEGRIFNSVKSFAEA